jgi:hypothetical protein
MSPSERRIIALLGSRSWARASAWSSTGRCPRRSLPSSCRESPDGRRASRHQRGGGTGVQRGNPRSRPGFRPGSRPPSGSWHAPSQGNCVRSRNSGSIRLGGSPPQGRWNRPSGGRRLEPFLRFQAPKLANPARRETANLNTMTRTDLERAGPWVLLWLGPSSHIAISTGRSRTCARWSGCLGGTQAGGKAVRMVAVQ